MLIGVELVPEKAITMAAGDHLRTWLTIDGVVVEGSEGLDEYEHTACFLAGRRLAATGRRRHFRVELSPIGLGPYETDPARPVFCPLRTGSALRLESETSNGILLDPGLYLDFLGLRIVGEEGGGPCFPLCRPDARMGVRRALHQQTDGSGAIPGAVKLVEAPPSCPAGPPAHSQEFLQAYPLLYLCHPARLPREGSVRVRPASFPTGMPASFPIGILLV